MRLHVGLPSLQGRCGEPRTAISAFFIRYSKKIKAFEPLLFSLVGVQLHRECYTYLSCPWKVPTYIGLLLTVTRNRGRLKIEIQSALHLGKTGSSMASTVLELVGVILVFSVATVGAKGLLLLASPIVVVLFFVRCRVFASPATEPEPIRVPVGFLGP